MGLSGLVTKPISRDNKFVPNILPSYRQGRELVNEHDQKALIKAYRSWVYICASRNATVFSSFPLRIYVNKPNKNSKTYFKTKGITKERRQFFERNSTFEEYTRKEMIIEEVIEHPFLELIKNVNAFKNRNDLMFLSDVYQELTGNAYWYLPKDRYGLPAEIWMPPPQNTTIVPDSKEFIKGYLYSNGQQKIPFDEN